MTYMTCSAALIGILLAGSSTAQEAAQPPRVDSALLASKAATLYRAGAAPGKTPRMPMSIGGNDPARIWKDHMAGSARRDDEGDGCLLSFTLGGDLDIRGYKGVRLFGATRTLSLPARETR